MQRHIDPLMEYVAHMRLRNLSARTITERHRAMNRLAVHLGIDTSDICAVLPSDLDKWQRDIGHLSARYRASYHSSVRGFFRWCLEHGYVISDPSRVLVVVQQPRNLPHPISEQDLELAIAGASLRVRPWLILAAYSGLRAAEIAGLSRDHVHDQSVPPVLRVMGKGNKERIVPLSRYVIAAMHSHGMPSRGPVFPRHDGKQGANHPWQISHISNRYLHEIGIPHSIHSLRHRFGTEVYRISQDIRVTQEVMGHSSPSSTAGYAAYSNVKAAFAIEELGGC
jgi:integrase/recombinase XerC